MDAFDLFKKLGAGAKFDFKRFRSDAEKLHVILFKFWSGITFKIVFKLKKVICFRDRLHYTDFIVILNTA